MPAPGSCLDALHCVLQMHCMDGKPRVPNISVLAFLQQSSEGALCLKHGDIRVLVQVCNLCFEPFLHH